METATSATLLVRMRDGADALAWRDFFDRYWRAMYAFAKGCGCAEATAEDAVQEAVLAVFENRNVFQYDPAMGRFRNWLFTIVRQKLALHGRRAAAHPAVGLGQKVDEGFVDGDDLPEANLESLFENALMVALLEQVRQEVSPETYQAFELTTLHELAATEVSRLTGLTRNAVYLARTRVFKRLKELGASYREDGGLDEQFKYLLRNLPSPAAERTMATRMETAMQSHGGTVG
jgi:RNA polymerase sigma-70 factor (ECF subfamily)